MKKAILAFVKFAAAAALVAAGGYYYARGGGAGTDDGAGSAPEKRSVPVSLTPAAVMTFEDLAAVQGNVRAKNFAMVSPVIGGPLQALHVNEGDFVKAGETLLFEVDSINLRNAFEVRRQDLAVAANGRREKEARLEQVQADFHKAEVDLRRYELLYEDNVVPVDTLELQQSRYKQTRAMLDLAHTLVQLGRDQEQQAAIAVEIARKNLNDAATIAPISGVVTMKLVEVGEMASAGHPVVRIEDPSELEVTAFLPAEHFGRVSEGVTSARIRVYGVDAGELPVTYRSPAINPKLRSFEVRCALPGPPEGVATGAIAEMAVILASRSGAAVPSRAVVTRGGKSVVYTVENGAARAVEVVTGLENAGWSEIVSGGVAEGAPVITMGQTLVEDGTPVSIQNGEK